MGAILRTRAFDCEVRAESNEKHGNYITGRAIVFNIVTNLGSFDEVIESGALDEADLRDVRMLINHDTKMVPVARSRNNNANSTLQLTVNDQGMDIRADLDTENNPDAKKLYSGVSRGDISGMSFMFYIKEQKWERMDTAHPLRRILKIERVLEVSAVTFPAYEATELSAREENRQALESAKEALESARRSLDSEKAEVERARAKALYNF